MTLLFDAGDYPLGQTSISGIGLRVAELAAALAHHFPVRIYSPATGEQETIALGDAELITATTDWPELLADTGTRAVFFFDMPDPDRIRQARQAGKLIVSENAPPIEQLEYPRFRRDDAFDTTTYQSLLDTYRLQLTASDLFIARSDIGRVTLTANLCAYGLLRYEDLKRSRTLDHRISTIPIGYSSTTAKPIPTAGLDRRGGEILWTGGLWQFMDPCAAVRAVATARANGIDIRLRFLHAAPHPDTHVLRAAIGILARDLGIAEHVVLHTDPIRHDDRDTYLANATALICLARAGIENQTCVRLRARDSRLHGLSLLVDPFGATATELARDGLAITVDPSDTEAIAESLAGLVTEKPPRPADPQEWSYERTAAPLIAQMHEQLN